MSLFKCCLLFYEDDATKGVRTTAIKQKLNCFSLAILAVIRVAKPILFLLCCSCAYALNLVRTPDDLLVPIFGNE